VASGVVNERVVYGGGKDLAWRDGAGAVWQGCGSCRVPELLGRGVVASDIVDECVAYGGGGGGGNLA
jgi:hypothetical protein